MMNGRGKSDSPVVPKKSPNKDGPSKRRGYGKPYTGTKAETPDTAKGTPTASTTTANQTAEEMEERGLAKGNSPERNAHRTQRRSSATSALERVRQAARKDNRQRFTALLHHVYDIDRLRAAYGEIERNAAAGIDGETWRHYGERLEDNLQDLSERLKRGAYRAKPVRRAYIPKTDGRQRPLGVPALEDKIVQRAVVEVLNAIYEEDFLGFSYGFRPGRSPHLALDALSTGILTKKVNWVLDADLRDFFGTLVHKWLVKFIEHRVADRRVVRLIQKWLNAGVLEDGKRTRSEVGTVQGGSISPLLANVYLHYVFDLWIQQWRKRHARGDVVVTRFADDFAVGFQHRHEAEQFLAELRKRFAQFGLELHPEKTRLIEFGFFAAHDRRKRGDGKPETFNFLGFTHICGRKQSGMFTVLRQTMRQRRQAKLKSVYIEMKRRRHLPIREQGAWLRSVVGGHIRYYGVPMNAPALKAFRMEVGWLWWRSLKRRSQKHRLPWHRMKRLIKRWLPPAHICHPYPLVRMGVVTQGKSRMR
jgi:group II intron reverse transcriptase/maturase